MSTPHNTANPGDFAKTVLMPGDPLRAKFIAETFLTDPVLVNNVRGIHGYTGTYRGTPVSVMASGMGIPSIGIYSYELYHFYGVENILRIGSAGAMQEHIRVRDLVFGMGACTNSAFASQYGLHGTFAPTASWELLSTAVGIAGERGLRFHVGNLLSSDSFYTDDGDTANAAWRKMGVLAIEMEAAGLYMTAAREGKRALALCTVSDHLLTGEATTPEERQTTFTEMMEVALETAVRMDHGKENM
ncbi:MAG: purine-nucleoside phosphorylase [Clostridia bacterium]|nr:purine-nucleoside phosphorylase [Clostridia bacterium]